jgi:hypothetical protein
MGTAKFYLRIQMLLVFGNFFFLINCSFCCVVSEESCKLLLKFSL